MTSTTLDTDDNCELAEEFQKLASLVPTIPKGVHLTELEFLEFVIAYIQQLQGLLSHNQWNESLHQLASSMKHSFASFSSDRNLLSKTEAYLSRHPLSTITLETNTTHHS